MSVIGTDAYLPDMNSEAEILKAMQAGQITGRDTTGLPLTAEPLKAESLEHTLKLLEFRQKDVKLWNAIPKLVAYNTVEEYLQLASYGQQRGGFYAEGELPDVEDSTYIRRAEHVKYLGVTGEVTLQAQMTRNFFDVYQKEVENKMMYITRLLNKSIVKADSTIIPDEFNSLFKQHASIGNTSEFLYSSFENYYGSGVVIDLRGQSIKQEDIESAAVQVDLNFGNVDTLFTTTTVISQLSKDYYKDQRIIQNADSAYKGIIGTVPKAISTTMGDVALMTDKFMAHDPLKYTNTPATSTKAPVAPVADGTTPSALVTDALTKYGKGGASEFGNVYYAVSAINKSGESALTVLGSAVTLASGKSVDLKFTAGVGANVTNGFVIYRSKVTTASSTAGLEFYPIFKVSTTDLANGFNGSAAGLIRDRGYFLPDTEEAFLTEMNEEVLSFKQLTPMSKIDLAIIALSRRFSVFLWGTPVLYTPKKFVRFINISKSYTA